MKAGNNPSLRLYGARVLRAYITGFRKQAGGILDQADTESLHQLRVAARRINTALKFFAPVLPPVRSRTWRKQIGRVRRVLGPARDTDVQVRFITGLLRKAEDRKSLPGIERLTLRLRRRRGRHQPGVEEAVTACMDSGVLDAMASWADRVIRQARKQHTPRVSPALFNAVRRSIARLQNKLRSFEAAVLEPRRIKELHQARIAAKHLRYALAMFMPLYRGRLAGITEDIRRVQSLLGAIHDCDVWHDFLEKFMPKETRRTARCFGRNRPLGKLVPGIRYVQADRRQHRAERYRAFTAFWTGLGDRDTFGRLQAILKTAPGVSSNGA